LQENSHFWVQTIKVRPPDGMLSPIPIYLVQHTNICTRQWRTRGLLRSDIYPKQIKPFLPFQLNGLHLRIWSGRNIARISELVAGSVGWFGCWHTAVDRRESARFSA
jgi:hypothetical protein